jgi:hypothetical protein
MEARSTSRPVSIAFAQDLSSRRRRELSEVALTLEA